MEIGVVDGCVLCGFVVETCEHLFFLCPFVQEVREGLLHPLALRSSASSWRAWVQWLLNVSRGSTRTSRMRRCVAAALVYEVVCRCLLYRSLCADSVE
ncbi:hypothetical protein Dimus_023127, partial [Dionaea muscipula]